ncbi:MAG: polyprenyl synthetase family protein [Anaerolineaceae bacterium]|nr:polyprenyl synthetase family protein [Anaerolineaceae bacterium]
MNLNECIQQFLPEIENNLKQVIEKSVAEEDLELHAMIFHHMGWEGEGAGQEAQGKRIRPLLTLLAATAAGGDWKKALPAAVSVELVHNFSLIHDDIQDCSETRRGRPTVWVKWGVAQAINTGDLMFTLAFYALQALLRDHVPAVVVEASRILQRACIDLTRGQYLDLTYEGRQDVRVEGYWPMVGGKTAALLSSAVELGALCAATTPENRGDFREYGYSLGLAFQCWDDWLGIWGDSAVTGKSVASDLLAGKKTLPVLYALNNSASFRERWIQGSIQPEEIPGISQMLIQLGAKEFTEQEATRLTSRALTELDLAVADGKTRQALQELTHKLLERKN